MTVQVDSLRFRSTAEILKRTMTSPFVSHTTRKAALRDSLTLRAISRSTSTTQTIISLLSSGPMETYGSTCMATRVSKAR